MPRVKPRVGKSEQRERGIVNLGSVPEVSDLSGVRDVGRYGGTAGGGDYGNCNKIGGVLYAVFLRYATEFLRNFAFIAVRA